MGKMHIVKQPTENCCLGSSHSLYFWIGKFKHMPPNGTGSAKIDDEKYFHTCTSRVVKEYIQRLRQIQQKVRGREASRYGSVVMACAAPLFTAAYLTKLNGTYA